ncbi:MAG TPA: protein translocase subunit SecD [Solirubrobacterales bacterium]|nr:protein translocase subunit SecD [Solirubrobacterales bacterium]
MGSRRLHLIVLTLVVALIAGAVYEITNRPTVLGLDLRGGTELVYEGRPTPQVPEVTAEDVDRAIEIIRQRVDAFGVAEPEITRGGQTQINVALPEVQDADRAAQQVGTTAQLYFYDWEPNVVPSDPDVEAPEDRGYNRLYEAVQAASKREPECQGCTANGPTLYVFDQDSLELLADPVTVEPEDAAAEDAPGDEGLTPRQRAEEDLASQFPNDELPENSEIVAVPRGTVVLGSELEPGQELAPEDPLARVGVAPYFILQDRPALSGDEIRNPEQNFDPTTNQPNVTFEFTSEGREAFHDVTREISQRGANDYFNATGQSPTAAPADAASQFSGSFAIILDGKIQSRPIINFADNPDGIDGRTGAQITGNFTVQSAQDLAEVLRIGALPIRLVLISSSTVSATLGQQALEQGLRAGIAGLILVVLFLIVYYRFLGIVAALGLLTYALLFFALIKLIPITLTLPGIAGLVLTIGIAADSNVVIFERIKEEVWKGKSLLSSIATGYRAGIATIVDANVIILITAFILFVLATAGVKGFAFTLGIGTIVSLFTAVLFTQAVLGILSRARFMRSRRFLGAGERKVAWNFDFAGAARWFFSISGAILAIGAIAFATRGFELGIDFESGARINASLEQEATIEEVRTALSEAGIPGSDSAKIQEVENPDFGENVVQIQAKVPPDRVSDVEAALAGEFGLEGGEEGFDSTSVGPTFGSQIAQSAAFAILFSLLVICAYVALRFEAKYAVPVLIALIHDILLVAGVYALSGREVTSATVAALLTVLGLSMYDTIIVFDRIRENVPRMPRAAFSQIANRSMSEILTRTIVTGLTTVFVLGSLLFFGGETLRDFAFAMLVGVISGFYSSIFIATPVLTQWKEREHGYQQRRAQIVDSMGFLPTFPEDNVVQKLGTEPEPVPVGAGDGAAEAEPVAAEAEPVAPAPSRADAPPPAAPLDSGTAEPTAPAEEADGAGAGVPDPERKAKREQRRKRQARRRRKHGRHR